MTRSVELAQVASDGVSEAFKNRIINGAMVVDQRNAGVSVTANDGTFSVDRWKCIATVNGKFSMQQDAGAVTPPAGFTDYLGATSTAATSVGASDFYQIRQVIEGFNFADCGWGTANAKTVTLSFWVRSSLTGTHGGMVTNASGGRSYPFSYTINAANTWEYETITIPGDTTGTWIGATNGGALQLGFNLGAGSTYSGTANTWAGTFYGAPTGAVQVVATNGATFYITGVQLEVGSTATSFETRSYGTELALCQRYYETAFPVGTAVSPGASYFWYTNVTSYNSTASRSQWIDFKATKRATPTVTPYRTNIVASNDNSWALYNGSIWYNSSSATSCYGTHHGFYAEVTGSGMSGVGYSYICIGAWVASAEL